MKIATGIEMLTVRTPDQGQIRPVHPTLVYDKHEAILIDSGFPGQGNAILEAISQSGIPMGRIKKLVITHQDLDHIGSIRELQKNQDLEIMAHHEEIKYIEGKVLPHKLAKFENYGGDIPANEQNKFERLRTGFQQAYVDVQTPLEDGQDIGLGLTVIHTPGHTDGHICLYHQPSKTLIAGDLFFLEDGKLGMPASELNVCCAQARESALKLKAFDIRQIITYHDGLYKGAPDPTIL